MYKSVQRTYRGFRRSEWIPNNGSAGTSQLQSSAIYWSEVQSGSGVPDYRGKIARVQDATSSYSRTGVVSIQPGSFLSTVGFTNPTWGGKEVVSGYLPEQLPGVVLSSKAYELALGNFLKEAGEAVSPFKGMVFLGELRETLKMLKSPASSLRNGISTYLKRARLQQRRHGAKLAIKGIAGMWLEYALGLQPLLGDIRDAALAYKSFENEYKYYRAFGKGTSSAPGLAETSSGLMGDRTYYLQDSITTRSTVVRFKGVAAHKINNVDLMRADEIARLSGFTLAEFVPTIWELIPGSFLADYFSNIGDILNSIHGLTADWRWTSVAQESTASKESKRRLNAELLKKAGLDYWSGGTRTPQILTVKNYDRWEPQLRLPTLVLELPPLGFQWATMLALVTQNVRA